MKSLMTQSTPKFIQVTVTPMETKTEGHFHDVLKLLYTAVATDGCIYQKLSSDAAWEKMDSNVKGAKI